MFKIIKYFKYYFPQEKRTSVGRCRWTCTVLFKATGNNSGEWSTEDNNDDRDITGRGRLYGCDRILLAMCPVATARFLGSDVS